MPWALLFGIGLGEESGVQRQLLCVLDFNGQEPASEQDSHPEPTMAQPQTLCSLHKGFPRSRTWGLVWCCFYADETVCFSPNV